MRSYRCSKVFVPIVGHFKPFTTNLLKITSIGNIIPVLILSLGSGAMLASSPEAVAWERSFVSLGRQMRNLSEFARATGP